MKGLFFDKKSRLYIGVLFLVMLFSDDSLKLNRPDVGFFGVNLIVKAEANSALLPMR